jgi:hypothetical protein
MKNTILEIKNDPAVLDVEFHSDTNLIYIIHFIKITFKNGDYIYINNYNLRGKEIKHKPMYVNYVNDYHPIFYSKNKEAIVRSNSWAIWSAVIGVRLETVVDISKNYLAISESMEKFTDLSKSNHKTKEVVENNLYSDTVTVDGQEYVLLKRPMGELPLVAQGMVTQSDCHWPLVSDPRLGIRR